MTESPMKTPNQFFCEKCAYTTSSKKDFNKHLLTQKHKRLTNTDGNVPKTPEIPAPQNNKKQFICDKCNNNYSCRQSLWKHKKCCKGIIEQPNQPPQPNTTTNNMMIDKEMFLQLVQDNQDFKRMLIELAQKNQIITTNNNNNNNTMNNTLNNNNQKFNLNLYLNETCKNAVNCMMRKTNECESVASGYFAEEVEDFCSKIGRIS